MTIQQPPPSPTPPAPLPIPPVPLVSTSKIDIYLSRVGNLTQVGVLALAIFGYFYTVIPVFQNQKLQEDNAKLEIEKSKANKTLEDLQAKQESVQKKIYLLTDELAQEKSKVSISRKHTLIAELREKEATLSTKEATAKLESEISNLDSAHRTILISRFESQFLFWSINNTNKYFDSSRDKYENNGDLFTDAFKLFIAPKIALQDMVKNLKESSDKPPKKYIEILEKFVAEASTDSCKIPDINELKKQYTERISKVAEIVFNRTNQEIKNQELAAKKENKRLIITDTYRKQLNATYEISEKYIIRNEFNEIILNSKSECDKFLNNEFNLIVNKIKPHGRKNE